MNKISILIVDDHPVVRQGIMNFLEAHGELEVKGAVSNGEEAIRAVEELQPDIVLMDLVMPGMDGIEAIRSIKNLNLNTRIIVMTSFAQDNKVFPAIKAGASLFGRSEKWLRTSSMTLTEDEIEDVKQVLLKLGLL